MIEDIPNLAPYVVITGRITSEVQAFLVVDKKIVSEVLCIEDIPFSLLSAFFVFNIQYPVGCSNFYAFMEVLILKFPVQKASITVKHFMATLM